MEVQVWPILAIAIVFLLPTCAGELGAGKSISKRAAEPDLKKTKITANNMDKVS